MIRAGRKSADAPIRVYQVEVDGRIVATTESKAAAIRAALRHRVGDADAEWTVTEVAA